MFSFLMGNGSNWPLLEVLGRASGGFYTAVSNSDDIVGQLLLAKSKIRHEALHNAALSVKGVQVSDVTDDVIAKVYRGEQLVILGHYDRGGEATIKLQATLSGEDKVYETRVTFPELDASHPELERIWAMREIELTQIQESLGQLDASESAQTIEELGVTYQLVTDETSMVVLDDTIFEKRGIARNNRDRVAIENQARSIRASQPVVNYQAPNSTAMFPANAHSISHGGGGGALDPISALLMGGPLLMFLKRRIKK
jgi:Ca-activated chloride channel family protein